MDDLEHLSDARLQMIFIKEVGQFQRAWSGTGRSKDSDGWRRKAGNGWEFVYDYDMPDFSTAPAAVMPYLDKHHCSIRNESGGGWQVSLLGGVHQMQVKGASTEKFLTFARAACIALIRAARQAK